MPKLRRVTEPKKMKLRKVSAGKTKFKRITTGEGDKLRLKKSKSGPSKSSTMSFRKGTFTDSKSGEKYNAVYTLKDGKVVSGKVDDSKKEYPIEEGKYRVDSMKTRKVGPKKIKKRTAKRPKSIQDLKDMGKKEDERRYKLYRKNEAKMLKDRKKKKQGALETIGKAINETYIKPIKKKFEDAKKRGGKIPKTKGGSWLKSH